MTRKTPSRDIYVDVTPEIITAATRRNSGHCVVADALKAAIPDADRVSVDLQTVRFSLASTGRRYIFLTPQAAQHVLLDFDQGIQPTPQRIRLGRPTQILETERSRTRRRKTNRRLAGSRLPKGDPDAKHVEMIHGGNGRKEPVIVGGEAPPIGALADPPKQRRDPTIGARRYAGQRRQFGLKIMRP